MKYQNNRSKNNNSSDNYGYVQLVNLKAQKCHKIQFYTLGYNPD
jgi:hypothetical protein